MQGIGYLYCTGCQKVLPVAAFYENEASRGLCMECSVARARKRRHENPGVDVDTVLKSKYGISGADRQLLLDLQGGKCAICRKTVRFGTKRGNDRLAIDHNHNSGAVCAILCSGCNLAIGIFKHRVDLLEAAAEYCGKHHSGDPT